MLRSVAVLLTMFIMTMVLGIPVIVASLVRWRGALRFMSAHFARLWSRAALSAAGVRLRVIDGHRISRDEARIYVCNHVSWFDVFALASILPRYRFVAKKELFKIPIFGPAAGTIAGIWIDRKNRKAAFDAYQEAAEQVRAGTSVVVYPEGTRGRTYQLRSFKKGPFVFAIAAGVPVVPVVIHGTIAVQPKGSLRVRAGDVEIILLEPVPTAGLGYDDRDQLMQTVWERMATALETRYGVRSTGGAIDTATPAA
jgi:1-acyl-sn-glycerol-3-phosphate acyltransferase